MNSYYALYNTSTGAITVMSLGALSPYTPGTGEAIATFPANDATASLAANNTQWFLISGNPATLTMQPYWILSTTQSGNTYTITATLNNPSATPPTSATLTVLGQALTATVTNNQITFVLDVHPSVAGQQVQLSVDATGCVAGVTTIGMATPTTTLQIYTPASGNSTIAPTTFAYLESYYASTLDAQTLFADIGTAVGMLMHTMHHVVIPTLQQTTWAPVPLDANQTSAHNDIVSNVLPNIYTNLDNALPSGGTKSVQYGRYVTDQGVANQSFAAYMQDMATIPNLH